MAAVLHRVTALVLTLVLALGAPLGTPRSCDRCPVGCPMHRESGTGHAGGCHHGKGAASAEGSVLRCACGHQRVAMPAAAEYALPPRSLSVRPILVAGVLPEVPAVDDTRFAPEPPADPPRLRVA
jgi:hypothetical protein